VPKYNLETRKEIHLAELGFMGKSVRFFMSLQTETKIVRVAASDYIRDYRDVERFLQYCKACGNYGTVWMCPPYDFDPLDRMKNFRYAHVIGTKILIDEATRSSPTNADEARQISYRLLGDVRKDLDKRLMELEKKHLGSLAFFAGSCTLCREEGGCARKIDKKPCRYPEQTRTSLEAYGFDIAKTSSELLGIELQWGKDLVLPEYFTLVSGFFTNLDLDPLEWT